MKILKRTISAVLALVLIAGMMPVSALAAEETAPAGDGVLDVPEIVMETTMETEPAETVPEETWEIAEVTVEDTAVAVATDDAPTSGTCGENLTWTLVDGVLTISGEGEMYDYYFDNYMEGRAPWHKLLESITSVVLRNGVTSIGKYAFYDCASLSSVTIPDSVTSIGEGAFKECDSLSGITIPGNVTSIGDYAFQYCASLSSITIPDSVTSIGNFAFSYCASLSSVTIGNSVTSLGSGAFRDCDSLSSITIPNNVTSIDDSAFSGCDSLSSITIPDSITYIGTWAFGNCASLSSITIPDSVTSIGYRAFSNCTSLSSITIPDRVTSISEYVFYDCASLSSVTIPDSVTSIGRCAFENCVSLSSIAIPDSVISIGYRAFYNCASLSSITIPDSVTTIEGYAFAECNKLKDVYYGGSQEAWNDIVCGTGNKVLQSAKIHFETGKVPDETVPEESETPTTEPEGTVPSTTEPEETEPEPIGGSLGSNMRWTLEDGVLTISGVGKMMSYGHYRTPWDKMTEEITSVIIGDGITNIGDCAFSGCTNLISVTIPDSVIDIGYQAFKDCTSLPGITIPNSVATIGQYAFSGCKSMTSIEIPDGVTLIEYGLFSGCKSLTSVTLPDGITEIRNGAFNSCEALPGIKVPNSVFSLGDSVFYRCNSLVDIKLPDSLTYIGKSAFEHCVSLPAIELPDSVEQLGEKAYYDCENLVSITLSGRMTEIAQSTFGYCKNLRSITIPDSVTTIQYHAFIICKNLKDVYYGGSKEQWENIEFTYYMNDHNNHNLLNANIHYNESSGLNNYYRLKVTPEETTHTVFSGRKLELTFSLTCNDFQVTEWDHPIVSFRELDILENKGWEQVGNNWVLTLSAKKPGREFMTVTDIKSGRYLKMWVEVNPAPIQSYVDNSEIHINGAGSAFAYYLGDPNTTYHYTVNGEKDTVTSDSKGIIRIMLGTYLSGTTHEHTVTFTQAGNKVLSPSISFQSTVIARDLEYTYESEISLKGSVGAAVDSGIGLSAGVGVGLGESIIVTKSYEEESCTLEVKEQPEVDAYGRFQLGMSEEFGFVDLDFFNISGKVTASGMGVAGFRIQNYAEDDVENLKAFATFLLGGALKEKPNNIYLREFQNWLAEKLYAHPSVDTIRGSGASISGEFEQGAMAFEINNVPLFTGLKQNMEASAAISEQTYGNGEKEYSTAYTTESDFAAVSLNVFGGILSASYLGHDVLVKVRKSDSQKKLETTVLTTDAVSISNIKKGEKLTANYDRYAFEEESLEELVKDAEDVRDYVNGDRFCVGNAELEKVAQFLSTSEVPIEYTALEKTHALRTIPLEFGPIMGAGMEFGVTASYLQSVEYETAGGYAVDDEILLTSESGVSTESIDTLLFNFDEWASDAVNSLKEDAQNFFTTVKNTVQNGAETLWGWIEGAADSVSNMFTSISCAASEGVWGISYEIGVKGDQVNFALARQSVNPSEAYVTKTAMTVGRPFIVNVTDGETGESIADFGEEPLEFTIRYAGEDLMAAGYNAETGVIAMYRYSDDGDYFEYIGGLHDAEAMTVTATITQPGQYILAVEEVEEEVGCGYAYGDANHDGKINAKDATLVLQKSVGTVREGQTFCELCADVTGDGKFNAKDSTMILRKSSGLLTKFPVEE